MSDFDPDDLDPGIRDLVLRLRLEGFDTTDSGDGVSKAVDGVLPECAEPFPNVHMVTTKELLLTEADRLQALFPEATIQADYNPRDRVCILSMYPEGFPIPEGLVG